MREALIRATCALACALAAHAALITGAAYLGWFSSDNATLPELDMTSVDLSFSETPEETAPPAARLPSPACACTPNASRNASRSSSRIRLLCLSICTPFGQISSK